MMFEILDSALKSMTKGPRRLARALEFFASEVDDATGFSPEALLTHLTECGANDNALSAFRRSLAQWDNADGDWMAGAAKNSAERRKVIYDLLGLDEAWIALCETRLAHQPLEEATVIAVKNTPWYTEEVRAAHAFYWSAYAKQLLESGWGEDAVNQLDQNTNRIVEKLANPAAVEAYQSKGLVVGYVQSGKTANFTGLIAKAADAGYRLIIVMAGVLDVLRSQTQRRIDKELIGQELLDSEYMTDPDYAEFAKHNGRPSALGAFDIYRLTGPDQDYQSLGYGKSALKFDRVDPARPFWDPENLHSAPARIAVVKKHPAVLQRLAKDLVAVKSLSAPLDQIPVLIIDDESDQASINTAAPSASGEVIDRIPTNKAIVELLNQLPRSQYIGFTATPSANALVDPDANDIFPKDFLISLPRPAGYMGVADFYDLDAQPNGDPGPNQRDYVRAVTGDDDKAENLLKAIDSFVLSGALKLYRTEIDPSLKFKHHTMLVHVSQLQAEQKVLAKEIRATFAKAGYIGGKGLERLEDLFENDFRAVYEHRGEGLPFPETFEDLASALSDCLQKIGEPALAVRIVNTEHKKDTPDFDRERVWKILVGGAKLSRGYTVEGLTVSYYRRRAGASDTLMQMGRWFGFRRGYRDLVRLFIGTDEIDGGPKSTKRINLYEAFGAICRDEEMFRKDLVRYAEDPNIVPAAVPPLVPSHMLRPTAANKMRNALITFRNYGGELSESTFAPATAAPKAANVAALRKLVAGATPSRVTLSGKNNGKIDTLSATVFETTPERMISFIESYTWYDPKALEQRFGNPLRLQLEFLRGSAGLPGIDRWLVMSPEIATPNGTFALEGAELHVVFRGRETAARLKTYNDPGHRAFARDISGQLFMTDPSPELQALRAPGTGVMLLYPITEVRGVKVKPEEASIGFTLLFPKNGIRSAIGFTVRSSKFPLDAIVDQADLEDNGADTPLDPLNV